MNKKKLIRFVIILIIAVCGLVAYIGHIEPTDVHVARSVLIHAPKEAVYKQIANFKEWHNWSPWMLLDTTMKIDYTGNDGQAGSAYYWASAHKMGEGNVQNTGADGSKMNFTITLTKPYDQIYKGYLAAEDTAGMTKATWSYGIHYDYPYNAMFLVQNMDKILGKDLENGMNNLKSYVETHATNLK